MATKRARTKMPLEWVKDRLTATTSGTGVQTSIDLDLLPNEVAEIHQIESQIVPIETVASSGTPTVDQSISAGLMLSMDPDVDGEPEIISSSNDLEDLEVFYDHQYEAKFDTEGTEANFQFYKLSEEKHMVFDPPILVGTNVGMNLKHTNSQDEFDIYAGVRIWFTRRKANVMELNQILLKRR